jgi:hypothetical protein
MSDDIFNHAWGWMSNQPCPGPFDYQYREWTRKRLLFLVQSLGEDWFLGKKIMEVGSGHGLAVRTLVRMGASPASVVTDVRSEYVDQLRSYKSNPEAEVVNAYVMDQNEEWSWNDMDIGKYDLIIHWGVHYHLTDWRRDLRCALKYAPLISLETDLCELDDPEYEAVKWEQGGDQAPSEHATVVSQPRLENYLKTLPCTFERLDGDSVAGCGVGSMIYNWKPNPIPDEPDYSPTNSKYFVPGRRRFYMIKRT